MSEIKKKDAVKKEKLKIYYTLYKTDAGVSIWEIKAKDWDEAEFICKRINHKLDGEKVII